MQKYLETGFLALVGLIVAGGIVSASVVNLSVIKELFDGMAEVAPSIYSFVIAFVPLIFVGIFVYFSRTILNHVLTWLKM